VATDVVCSSCGYQGAPAPRSWIDIAIGVGSLLTGGGPGIVEHWRDIISGKTCPRCGNPKTRYAEDSGQGEV